jgi:hypothetical protein
MSEVRTLPTAIKSESLSEKSNTKYTHPNKSTAATGTARYGRNGGAIIYQEATPPSLSLSSNLSSNGSRSNPIHNNSQLLPSSSSSNQ